MSNSKLISCTLISPNKNSPRNHKIDTITIHCVVGQCSAERIGEIFKPTSRQASSNYGIGYDGRIGLYVDEADRSWCSSSAANDNRAITIEVASDTKHPYAVNDKAYAALLDLVEDICRRNGIKKLVWSTSKDDRVNHKNGCNMTVHRDYANKSCPGDYLYNRHGEIAAEVNRRLGVPAEEQKPEQKPQGDAKSLYRVQLGAFEKKDNATAFAAKLKKEGFDTYIVQIGKYYKVQVGAFSVKKNAEAMLEKLKKAGHDDAFITFFSLENPTRARTTATATPEANSPILSGRKVKEHKRNSAAATKRAIEDFFILIPLSNCKFLRQNSPILTFNTIIRPPCAKIKNKAEYSHTICK